MKLIHAVYERGVFRPTDPVELPDGCCVEFEPRFTVEATANDSLRRRLDELRQLRDGWLDGKGLAPSSAGLDWLSRQFKGHYPDDLPLPFAYPTAEGGIQFEWSVGGFEASLEIDLLTHAGQWHRLNLRTEVGNLKELDLNSDDDWEVLASAVRGVTQNRQGQQSAAETFNGRSSNASRVQLIRKRFTEGLTESESRELQERQELAIHQLEEWDSRLLADVDLMQAAVEKVVLDGNATA